MCIIPKYTYHRVNNKVKSLFHATMKHTGRHRGVGVQVSDQHARIEQQCCWQARLRISPARKVPTNKWGLWTLGRHVQPTCCHSPPSFPMGYPTTITHSRTEINAACLSHAESEGDAFDLGCHLRWVIEVGIMDRCLLYSVCYMLTYIVCYIVVVFSL